jgi:hypothetical protein
MLPGKVLLYYVNGEFAGYLALGASEKMVVGLGFCSTIKDRNLYQFAMLKAIEVGILNGKETMSIGVGVNDRMCKAKARLGFVNLSPPPEMSGGTMVWFDATPVSPYETMQPDHLTSSEHEMMVLTRSGGAVQQGQE